MECSNKCGQIVFDKRKSKCEKCKDHKFWHVVDIDEYNINEGDNRKHLKLCRCGHKYVMWNRYQHEQSKHHKRYLMKRDNLDLTLENFARICNKRDNNDTIHGRWSAKKYDICPKCKEHLTHKPADVTIESSQAIDIHISNQYADIHIYNNNTIESGS